MSPSACAAALLLCLAPARARAASLDETLAAARAGNAAAQKRLGSAYKNGLGVQQDFNQAVFWYRKSAAQGDAEAQNSLGDLYQNEAQDTPNLPEALKWYLKAAAQGNVDAQDSLGHMYQDGLGVASSWSQAARWYRAAAMQGNADAQKNLGDIFRDGRGVRQDQERAAYWYRKSAAQGNSTAQDSLGELMASGGGSGAGQRVARVGATRLEDASGSSLRRVEITRGGGDEDAPVPAPAPARRSRPARTIAAAPRPQPAAAPAEPPAHDAETIYAAPRPAAQTAPLAVRANPESAPQERPAQESPPTRGGAGTAVALVLGAAAAGAGGFIFWRRRKSPKRQFATPLPAGPPSVRAGPITLTAQKAPVPQPPATAVGAGADPLGIVKPQERAIPSPKKPEPTRSGVVHVLSLAMRCSDAAEHEMAVRLLEEKVLCEAVTVEGGCEKVIRILDRADKLDAMTGAHFATMPPPVQAAYTKALHMLGKYADALRTMRGKKALTKEDRADLFELLVRCGDFERARLLCAKAFEAKPVKDHAELYYQLGRVCEDGGVRDLASRLYLQLSEAGLRHKDAETRLSRLRDELQGAAEVGGGIIGGKYAIKAKIGEGGMGLVFEGYDTKLGRKVAIKKMRDEIRTNPKAREAFLREAKIISNLSHPYIVGIHEIVEERNALYLVFDYVDGKTLWSVLQERGRLPLKECQVLFGYICSAIEFAHANRVLHRDLKPSNIMLDKQGYAKVMDFGLAREAKDSISKSTHTEVAGTPGYMSPEQHLGEPKKESDIYALGVCLYEMLSGYPPFKGPDYLAQKERKAFAPLRSLVAELPPEIEPLISRVLEPDVPKRFPSALKFLEALNRCKG
ncbi:MAG: protein kinase [Elusimicrobia bacterium]|nr:protein kinase [Elusimicrobiota bacterium]